MKGRRLRGRGSRGPRLPDPFGGECSEELRSIWLVMPSTGARDHLGRTAGALSVACAIQFAGGITSTASMLPMRRGAPSRTFLAALGLFLSRPFSGRIPRICWRSPTKRTPITVRADRTRTLSERNSRRHEAALKAAEHVIQQLTLEGQPLSLGAVVHAAGVSRGWLYRQPDIPKTIERLRPDRPTPTAQPASIASLRERLDNTRAEISRLVPRTTRYETNSLATSARNAKHRGPRRQTSITPTSHRR